jgi:hypothetical protein
MPDVADPEWPGPDQQTLRRDLDALLWHPRDEYDDEVHPESLRGRALSVMDETARIVATLPWWARLYLSVAAALRRH